MGIPLNRLISAIRLALCCVTLYLMSGCSGMSVCYSICYFRLNLKNGLLAPKFSNFAPPGAVICSPQVWPRIKIATYTKDWNGNPINYYKLFDGTGSSWSAAGEGSSWHLGECIDASAVVRDNGASMTNIVAVESMILVKDPAYCTGSVLKCRYWSASKYRSDIQFSVASGAPNSSCAAAIDLQMFPVTDADGNPLPCLPCGC